MSRNLIFNDLKKHHFNQKQIFKNYDAHSSYNQRKNGSRKNYHSSSREYLGLVQPSAEKSESKSKEPATKESKSDNIIQNTKEQFESQDEQQYTSNDQEWKESNSQFNRYQSEYTKSNK